MGKEEKILEDAELISQVRMRGLKPCQIFKTDEIMEDSGFKKTIEAEVDYRIYVRDQEAEEELNKEMEKEIEEQERKEIEEMEENELIPDSDEISDKGEKEKEQKKEKKESSDDNPLISDDSDSGEESDNELIPE